MKLYHHDARLPDRLRGGVIALGNFDGVHRGHQTVLSQAATRARFLKTSLGVVTFSPHPQRFFHPEKPAFEITPLPAKQRLLATTQAEWLYLLKFDANLASVSATDFIKIILIDRLGIRCVVTGEDFMFGNHRSGNKMTLETESQKHGFEYIPVPIQEESTGFAYASTRIRDCLRQGDMKTATRLLGHSWEIEGRVINGQRRARDLGFPTANMSLGTYIAPAPGVYAIQACPGETTTPHWYEGIANYGRRPTFGSGPYLFESHLFDFDRDLYGQSLRVRVIDFLRKEMPFPNPEALQTQMRLDCQKARSLLKGSHILEISPLPPG